MMYEYLKKKGMGGMNEHEFMDMFDSRSDRFSDRFNESGMGGNDMDKMMRYMRNSMNGEHFTESEAKYLVADMYVAVNSQYHDYAELFKNWSGDGIEQKIVESAIVFWFKDADCKAGNKVVEYLGEY